MYQVKKRNGNTTKFDINKIKLAITKAFEALDKQCQPDIIDLLTLKVTAAYETKVCNDLIFVEDIQDAVEKTLSDAGYADVAKAYILYRKEHERVRNINSNLVNYKDIVDNYLKINDWRVKENSTVTYSIGGLILSNSGAISANYWLSEVYDNEIAEAHRSAAIHLHDLSILAPYCAGWSLKQLIQEGLGGVVGKITSAPASHLSTLCNQMVNFLGIMQNEWAGAQAFSSFDTYLAPFVKVDNLSYKEVRQALQSFIYGVNTPSRWGCVDTDTEVLSVNGFKKYNELHEGELIYTWHDGKLELNTVNKVIVKPHKGKLHEYKNKTYIQTVTPNHRVLVRKHNSDEYEIKLSEDIIHSKTPYALPTKFYEANLDGIDITDEEVQLAAYVYADGSFDFRNGSIHKVKIHKSPNRMGNEEIINFSAKLGLTYTLVQRQGAYRTINTYTYYGESARKLVELTGGKTQIDNKFFNLNSRQSKLFLDAWALFDGDEEKMLVQCDNQDIVNGVQHIALRAGYTTYIYNRRKTTYVKFRENGHSTYPTSREEIDYDGLVWCPNVDNGTAIFRKNGCVFISGQTQAPFSNITLDWVVPKDLKDLPAIVGGKDMDFTYGDCQKEMDMVNKAFIELMIEGDANGRGFQYPIPTYSITKDFDWSETENNKLLFEMTAKYGTPYFSNYINSDMEPNDVRSMAILGTQNVIYKDKFGRISKNEIRHLVNQWQKSNDIDYSILMNGKFVKVTEMFEIPYENYDKYVQITLANGYKQSFSYDHKCIVVRDNKTIEVLAQDLQTTDLILLAKHPYNDANIGDYASGKIVGYYLAEGWVAHNNAQLTFAININREDICQEIYDFFTQHFAARVSINKCEDTHVFIVKVYSKGAVSFVTQFIEGDRAINKHITTFAYDTSCEFRQGLYDGYLETDGSKANNIFAHTTNKQLCRDIIDIFSTIGKYFKCRTNNKNTRYFKRDKSDLTTFTSYELTIFNPQVYNDDFYVVNIKSVDLLDASRITKVYNFTVDTPEHLYELPNGIITHQCCRLRLDLRELRKKSGGFFGSGESTGSIGVVTLNLPRIAYLSVDENDFYKRLDKLMDISARSLKIKRTAVTEFLNGGLYPYTKRYLGTFANHFSTIGLVGMNEAGLNAKWLKKDLTNSETQKFARDVLDHMRERLSDYQEQYGDLYNLEATPAESTAFRFAKHDKETYPDIITANENGTPYYTNSSHLPVSYTEDVFSALQVQDELQTRYTSGTVFHAFLGEKLPDWKAAADLVKKIAYNFKLPYYTLSPTYSVCKEHGYLQGEQFVCPHCNQITEVYSRITGYYRPVQNWNDGKAQEYKDRQTYNIPKSNIEGKGIQEQNKTIIEPNTTISNTIETILFATKTCPNCALAEKLLKEKDVQFQKLYADENKDKVQEYDIRQAPTLIVNGNKLVGLGEIRKFFMIK